MEVDAEEGKEEAEGAETGVEEEEKPKGGDDDEGGRGGRRRVFIELWGTRSWWRRLWLEAVRDE